MKPNDGTQRQYVVLELADELYGVDIEHVNTVLMHQEICPVPGTPGYMKGIMNLRGKVLPVIDLRERLLLPPRTTPDSRIVILNVAGAFAGMIVDGVSEVVALPPGATELTENVLSSPAALCISGVARLSGNGSARAKHGQFLLLLDVMELLDSIPSDTCPQARAA